MHVVRSFAQAGISAAALSKIGQSCLKVFDARAELFLALHDLGDVRVEGVSSELVVERVFEEGRPNIATEADTKGLDSGCYEAFDQVIDFNICVCTDKYWMRHLEVDLQEKWRISWRTSVYNEVQTLSNLTASMMVFVLPVPGGYDKSFNWGLRII